jgi:hypothetical protein
MTAEEFDHNWARILPFFDQGKMRMFEEFLPEDIFSYVMEKQIQAFKVQNEKQEFLGVIFTEICSTPRKRWIQIFYVTGLKARIWIPLADMVMQEMAREVGATEIRALGRLGWKDYPISLGYTARQILFVKEIGHERGREQQWRGSNGNTKSLGTSARDIEACN